MERVPQRQRLPNRITSDVELKKWCASRLVGFTDVVDRTKFRQLFVGMKPGQSAIINLDPKYVHGGTHWVAAKMSNQKYTDPDGFKNNVLLYCDSFGAPPPLEVVAAARDRRMRVLYPNNIVQKLREVNCGKRACEWLVMMDRPDDVDELFRRYQ